MLTLDSSHAVLSWPDVSWGLRRLRALLSVSGANGWVLDVKLCGSSLLLGGCALERPQQSPCNATPTMNECIDGPLHARRAESGLPNSAVDQGIQTH